MSHGPLFLEVRILARFFWESQIHLCVIGEHHLKAGLLESILSFYLEMGVLRTLMDRFGIHVSKPCNHLILSVRADMI